MQLDQASRSILLSSSGRVKPPPIHVPKSDRGEQTTLRELRPYQRKIGEEWFANLRMDPESLSDT